MLKLTQADYGTQTEGDPIYVNPAQVWHVIPQQAGSYVHCGSAMNGHGWWVKETAEEVARMMNEANIPGLLRAGKPWVPPEGTPIPDNPFGVRIVPLGSVLPVPQEEA